MFLPKAFNSGGILFSSITLVSLASILRMFPLAPAMKKAVRRRGDRKTEIEIFDPCVNCLLANWLRLRGYHLHGEEPLVVRPGGLQRLYATIHECPDCHTARGAHSPCHDPQYLEIGSCSFTGGRLYTCCANIYLVLRHLRYHQPWPRQNFRALQSTPLYIDRGVGNLHIRMAPGSSSLFNHWRKNPKSSTGCSILSCFLLPLPSYELVRYVTQHSVPRRRRNSSQTSRKAANL